MNGLISNLYDQMYMNAHKYLLQIVFCNDVTAVIFG